VWKEGLLVWLVARRPMLRWILWIGLALFPLVFLGPVLQDASTFKYAALLVTLVVGMQYNYWGNYLPRVFPLHLRGTAQWDAERVAALPADASLADLAGGSAQGRLALTLDPRDAGALYQGIVSLDATSIAASIEHYLATSEQLPSRLWLRVDAGCVRGLLLQRLPGHEADGDATWARLGVEADAGVRTALEKPHFAQILQTIFAHDDLRVFDAQPVTFRCRCSVARVANALRIAGRDEIEAALAERGVIDVTCEFCNRRYSFTPAEARALVAGADPASSEPTGVMR